MTHFSVSVLPFEIGSHTGFVSKDNRSRLASLHKFCKRSIKLKKLINNISAICMMGSYYIFDCRSLDGARTKVRMDKG